MRLKPFCTVLLLIFILLSSCSLEMGLLYSIYSEEPVGDSSLPEGVSAFSLTSDTADVRLLAAGGLYVQEGIDDWSLVTLPEAIASSLAQTVLYIDPDYYVFFTALDGSGGSLYKTSNPAADDISLDEVDISGIGSLVNVISAEGQLFVVSVSSGSYAVGMYNGSTYTEVLSGLTSLRRSFDAAYDGSEYHLIWGDGLYSGTAGSTFSEVDLSGSDMSLAAGDYFGGIHYDRGNIYISVNSLEDLGTVWKNDGTVWTSVTADLEVMVIHDFCSYTASNGTELILAGSIDGYYESPASGTAGFATPEVSCSKAAYSGIALSTGVVHGFYTSDDDLYALTLNNGLWKNSEGIWTLE